MRNSTSILLIAAVDAYAAAAADEAVAADELASAEDYALRTRVARIAAGQALGEVLEAAGEDDDEYRQIVDRGTVVTVKRTARGTPGNYTVTTGPAILVPRPA